MPSSGSSAVRASTSSAVSCVSKAHRLQAWRDEFLAGGIEGLKARPLQPEDRRLRDAERKIGELTMDNEILRAAARKRGLQIPPRKRPR
jgi:hypothetical protein